MPDLVHDEVAQAVVDDLAQGFLGLPRRKAGRAGHQHRLRKAKGQPRLGSGAALVRCLHRPVTGARSLAQENVVEQHLAADIRLSRTFREISSVKLLLNRSVLAQLESQQRM